MAHFAKLDTNNKVIAVIVVNNEVITIDGVESEQKGIEFLTNLYNHTSWKQTSYNSSFRKNFASVGGVYDETRDAFLTEKSFPSWVLNEETCRWEAPVPKPNNTDYWFWYEPEQKWLTEEEFKLKV